MAQSKPSVHLCGLILKLERLAKSPEEKADMRRAFRCTKAISEDSGFMDKLDKNPRLASSLRKLVIAAHKEINAAM